jgi:hypothetical protein
MPSDHPHIRPAAVVTAGFHFYQYSKGNQMSDPILRVFISSDKPLSDGSFLRRNAIPEHFSCHGDWLALHVAGHLWKLRANVSAVSAGDRRQTISADGRKHEQTFREDGTVIDFILPRELLSRVRAATLQRGIGLSTAFQPTEFYGEEGEEFTGVELTANTAAKDTSARFELIEL